MTRLLRLEWVLAVFDRVQPEHLRIGCAWLLLVTTALWIVGPFTFVRNEPPTVVHLSFAALWFSVATLLVTTDLEKKDSDT